MKAQEIVDYWYNEHKKYEFETPGWQTGTNYFTQIIWRSTKEVCFFPNSFFIGLQRFRLELAEKLCQRPNVKMDRLNWPNHNKMVRR